MHPTRRQFLFALGAGLGVLHRGSIVGAEDSTVIEDTSASLWPQLCRPHLEWINWDANRDFERYVEQLVQRAKAIRSDTLVFCYESGGYLLYPGDVAPHYRHLQGYDLLGAVERAVHDAGMKFCVCFLGMSGNTFISGRHPEWIQMNSAGERMGKWHGYNFRSLCPNSPYRDYLARCAREILERYTVDGIYVEGIYMPPGYCYCEFCRQAYHDQYDRAIPTEDLPENREYHEFRQRSCAGVWRTFREVIQETSPSTLLFGGINAAYWFGDANFDLTRCNQLADVICIEGQWNYDLPSGFDPSFAPELRELGLILQIMRAEGRKPVLSTVWIAKHVDQNYSPRSKANVTLNFAELLFQGATVQAHTQNALEVDNHHQTTLADLNKTVARLQPWLANSRVVADVGLVRCCDPRDQPAVFDRSLRGYYKALVEHHIPARVITDRDLRDGLANDCGVWVFPDAREIHPAVAAQIAHFVAAGGGVVFTYRTIERHPELAKLAGVQRVLGIREYSASQFPLHTYYRIAPGHGDWGDLPGTLLSFQGSRVDVLPGDSATVVARVVGLDSTRMSEADILRAAWPAAEAEPLVLMSRHGSGRVCTILGDLDAAARRYGDPQTLSLLASAVLNVSGSPVTVRSDAPPSVEIVTHQSDAGVVVLLLNQTTNQTTSDPIRYVVPLRDLSVTLSHALVKPRVCCTLSGQTPELRHNDDTTTVTIRHLHEYEGLLFSIAASDVAK